MEDLVSIIIPVYNAEKFIEETIKNIQEQTYTNWELILVDDCSKDSSIKIIEKKIEKDKRIKLIKNTVNSGPAITRNNGIEAAKGKYLCFLDADDKCDLNKIEKQVNFMKEKDCAFSYHSYEFADENCIPSGKKVIADEIMTYKKCLRKQIISTITVMFDLDKIDKSLIKMPNLKYVEDTATWWKVMRNGYNAYGIADVFSYYRRMKNTHSSNKKIVLKALWNLYRKEEKLNIIQSTYYFVLKNINAVMRRV